jgi:hypothetical protein
VKQKIGNFALEKIIIVILRFDHHFHCFFPYLLGDLVDPFLEKAAGIGLFGRDLIFFPGSLPSEDN